MGDMETESHAGVSGEVAVGGRLLVFGSLHGAEVMELADPPASTERTPPILLRPDPVRLLDREVELSELESSIAAGSVLQIVGEAGVGKTTLLRHLAHGASTDASPDGVVYLGARGLRLADLAQLLFNAVVVSSGRTKATPSEVRHAVGNKRLLVIVDDLELSPAEADDLVELLPASALVVASKPGVAVRDAKVVPIGGLPADASGEILARYIGHELGEGERENAAAISSAVAGNPSRLLQAGAIADWRWARIAELAAEVSSSGMGVLSREALATLTESEQRVLAAVALPDAMPIHSRHIVPLSGVEEAGEVARQLVQNGLIILEDDTLRLADDIAAEVEAAWPLTSARNVALAYLTGWAEGHRRLPDAVAEESRAIVALARWATTVGQHREVLRLAWSAESSLALGGRWGAWGALLDAAHAAALELGDRAAEAWVLHQQGTRSAMLEDGDTAQPLLARALDLREEQGDAEAAEATRRMMDHVPEGGKSSRRPSFQLQPEGRGRLLALLGAVVVAAIVVGVVLATRGGDDPVQTSQPPAATDPTPAETPPPTPSPSPTPTPTPPAVPLPPVPPSPTGESAQTIPRPNAAPIGPGSENNRTRRLQQALRALGYDPGTVDGAYGPSTAAAITAFQEANNLTADGVAGPATIRAINIIVRQLP